MITPVLFPDVELHFTAYLRSALAARAEPYASGVKVDRIAPTALPARLVTIRRDGGSQLDQVRESARLTVNVWHETPQGATDLARLVRALLWASPTGSPVLRVELNSAPSVVPEENGRAHLVMVFDAWIRGTNLGA